MCGGPLKCGGPCSAEHVRTLVNPALPRLTVCHLLVWRVCDQAFGRYRPLKGAEKWSRDHREN